jgi:hypothetical protein
MKKVMLAVLLAAAMIVGVGCGKKQEETEPEESVLEIEEVEAEPVEEPQNNINLLTGLNDLSDEAVGKRPVAIMVNNLDAAMPQYGIEEADIMFELPVEADITRLMCVYGDYTKVPKICPIRSCRYYYPILASGFDAIYVHWGQDPTIAQQTLNSLDIDTLNGLNNTYGLFGRDKKRKSSGYALEHTGYFDGTKLAAALEENNVRTDLKDEKTGTAFAFQDSDEVVAASGDACTSVKISFNSYKSAFEYNADENVYYKTRNGSEHIDGNTDNQLSFTNVIVLETDISVRDEKGRKNIDWKGGSDAKGYYISGGSAQEIRWSKSDEYDYLKFTDLDGNELKLNKGKSYIAFTYADNTKLSAE